VEEKGMAAYKKNAKRLGAALAFIDESGFRLIPCVVQTWAPRGETPLLRHRFQRDKLSVISAVSVSPGRQRLGLYWQLHSENIGQKEVRQFLRYLLRHIRKPLIALLDNSRTHTGRPLEKLQRRHPRLRIEYFPAYAPELNPDEGVWSLAKRELANSRPDDFMDLVLGVSHSLERIAASPSKLRGCIKKSGLPLFLP
jgi:transposase